MSGRARAMEVRGGVALVVAALMAPRSAAAEQPVHAHAGRDFLQVMQKVEGHITFHTAMSTAFPQPAPGSAPSPGPMKVEADRLKKVLGLSRISFQGVDHPIAITDVPLEEATKASAGDREVSGQIVVG